MLLDVGELSRDVTRKGEIMRGTLELIASRYDDLELMVRGRGLIQGLECPIAELAPAISQTAFGHGVILETSGPDSSVVKLLPSLLIDDASLRQGLDVLARSFAEVVDLHEDRIAELCASNERHSKEKGFDA